MPGQSATERSPGELLDAWVEQLGYRGAARRLGVSHVAVRRYHTRQRPLPSEIAERLRRELETPASHGRPGGLLEEITECPGDLTSGVIRARGTNATDALVRLLATGEVVEVPTLITDQRGRRYRRVRLFAKSAAPPAAAQRDIDGAWVRERLDETGRRPKWLAAQLDVHPSAVRAWVTGHAGVPTGRHDELVRLLEPALTGADIKKARTAAGWSLEQFGARAGGVKLHQVHGWEAGRRPILAKRMVAVRRAVAEAEQAAVDAANAPGALEEAVDAVVAFVGDHPGQTPRSLRHRWHGQAREVALDEALRRGRVVERVVSVPGPRGAQRRVARCYLPDAAPPVEAILTGAELRRRRIDRGLLAVDLEPFAGVSASAVSSWERLGDRPIPSWRVPGLLRGLEEATRPRSTKPGGSWRRGAAPLTTREVRGRLVAALDGERLPPSVLLYRVGRSPKARAELDRLLQQGTIVQVDDVDRLGRPLVVLALASDAAAEVSDTEAPFVEGELRSAREALGLSQRELAQRAGVSASKVSQYETGTRRVTRPRLAALRSALAQGPPAAVDPVEAEMVLVLSEIEMRGRTKTELGLGKTKTREHRPEAIERLVVVGRAHWKETAAWRADGRPYRRLELCTGPAPDRPAVPRLAGDQLRALMGASGLDQSSLGRRLGVTQSTVWHWLSAGVPDGRVSAVLEALAPVRAPSS